MRRLYFILLFTLAYSTVIHVPSDYTTIQAGINASVDGDTVLVADGIYYENLVVSKSIVLASHAIYDDLTDWVVENADDEWVVNNPHIQNTQIIGSHPDNEALGSVILITTEEDTCISPEIMGFSIKNGLGTQVVREVCQINSDINEEECMDVFYNIGGGILADISDPLIHYNGFYDNGNSTLTSGGAIQLTSSTEDWSFNDRENRISRCDVQEFRLANNLYKNNDAQYGNSVANRFHQDEFDMSGSIFDVYNCGGGEGNEISLVWVDVEEEASVDYSASEGNTCAFTASDVYVDPDIDEECLDEGCGFQNNPFKTITRTLEIILPSDSNPITIHLAEGTYSPETGEVFPINLIDNVNIEGNYLPGGDPELPHLDAMQTSRVMTMKYYNGSISNVIIENGYLGLENCGYIEELGVFDSLEDCTGGGMYVYNSTLSLDNVHFVNNYAFIYGGGLYLENSISDLSNIEFYGNYANEGGGLYMREGDSKMNTMEFTNNQGYSAAIEIVLSSPELNDVIVDSNTGFYDEDGNGPAGYAIRVLSYNSAPILRNFVIANNECSGIMLTSHADVQFETNPYLSHATIFGNLGLGIWVRSISSWPYPGPSPIIRNIIEYGNSGFSSTIDEEGNWQSFENCGINCWQSNLYGGYIGEYLNCDIAYSSITTCAPGEEEYFLSLDGNIVNQNPNFADGFNSNYMLQPNSPCIDSGSPNIWNNDIDGTRSDMGYFGGLFIVPNFTDYDFNEVGSIQSSVDFTLFNYRDTPITINSVLFESSSFSSNTLLPITIQPLETGIIEISCLPDTEALIEDFMVINSNELPEGLGVNLSATGNPGENLLIGNLSGLLSSGIYEVTSDIVVNSSDTLIIEPGTELLFHNGTGLTVNGVLKAQGTEQDSITFDSYCPPIFCGSEFFSFLWNGIHFNNVTDATELSYVKIETDFPDMHDEFIGMSFTNSNPLISNVLFSSKGILSMSNSNPNISNITFTQSGAINVHSNSSPIFNNIIINTIDDSYSLSGFTSENSSILINDMIIEGSSNNCMSDPWSNVIELINSNFSLDNVIVKDNCLGTGIYIEGYNSNGNIINTVIDGNNGNGLHIVNSSPSITNIHVNNNQLSGILVEQIEPCTIDVDPRITNVLISGNGHLIDDGNSQGAVHLKGASPKFINATIVNNVYSQGAGIYFDYSNPQNPFFSLNNNNPIFVNSIIYNNQPVNYYENIEGFDVSTYSDPSFSHSNFGEIILEDWEDLGGNININPEFVDPENGDYTLQEGSPCIDAGTADIDGDGVDDITDFIGLAPDMGAYEYGATDEIILGDTNSDGIVDILDILRVVSYILGTINFTETEYQAANYNGDDLIDILDILQIINYILSQ